MFNLNNILSFGCASPSPVVDTPCAARKLNGEKCAREALPGSPYCLTHGQPTPWHARFSDGKHLTWRDPLVSTGVDQPSTLNLGTADTGTSQELQNSDNREETASIDLDDSHNSIDDILFSQESNQNDQVDKASAVTSWNSIRTGFPEISKFLEKAGFNESSDAKQIKSFAVDLVKHVLQTRVTDNTMQAFLGGFKPMNGSCGFLLIALLPKFNSQSFKTPFDQLEALFQLILNEKQVDWASFEASSAATSASTSATAEKEKLSHWGTQIAGTLQEAIVANVKKNDILESVVGFPRTLLMTVASVQSATAQIQKLATVVSKTLIHAASQGSDKSQESRRLNTTDWQADSTAREIVEQFAKEHLDPSFQRRGKALSAGKVHSVFKRGDLTHLEKLFERLVSKKRNRPGPNSDASQQRLNSHTEKQALLLHTQQQQQQQQQQRQQRQQQQQHHHHQQQQQQLLLEHQHQLLQQYQHQHQHQRQEHSSARDAGQMTMQHGNNATSKQPAYLQHLQGQMGTGRPQVNVSNSSSAPYVGRGGTAWAAGYIQTPLERSTEMQLSATSVRELAGAYG